MSENVNKESQESQEEFLETVERNLRRSEKDIWFVKNENHPQKEGLTKGANK